MDHTNVIRKIFELRLLSYCENPQKGRTNEYRSPIYDILNVADLFALFNIIQELVNGKSPLVSKRAWSKIIWERAWKLDDADWNAYNYISKDNDLLALTVGKTWYLTWWYISDIDYTLVRMCETMAKMICHTSRLKKDDFRLKGLSMSNRTCIMCDMYSIEDIIHLLTQCPYYRKDRDMMYAEIFRECPNAMKSFKENRGEIPYFLLGRGIPYGKTRNYCAYGVYQARLYAICTIRLKQAEQVLGRLKYKTPSRIWSPHIL